MKWTFDREFGYVRNEDGDVLVSIPHGPLVSDEHDHARGYLMAAAPEMWDICMEVYKWALDTEARIPPPILARILALRKNWHLREFMIDD